MKNFNNLKNKFLILTLIVSLLAPEFAVFASPASISDNSTLSADVDTESNVDVDTEIDTNTEIEYTPQPVTDVPYINNNAPLLSNEELEKQLDELSKDIEVVDLSAGDVDYSDDELQADMAIVYPATYDPRSSGFCTPVEDQGVWGLCWAYATLAASELSMIKTGLANNTIDFSELYLAYTDYLFRKKRLGHDFVSATKGGGGEGCAYQYMSKGYGPVLESTVPWQEPTNAFFLSDDILNSHTHELYKIVSTEVSSAYRAEELESLKYMIYTYGAATMGIYSYSSSTGGFAAAPTENSEMTFYAPVYNYPNHLVTVVGWDDNYPATNFIATPPANGAWLCKNSWGTGSTTGNGYFWISYYDQSYHSYSLTTPVFVSNGTHAMSIKINEEDTALYVGESATFTATLTPASATDYEWGTDPYLSMNANGTTCTVTALELPDGVYEKRQGVACEAINTYGTNVESDTLPRDVATVTIYAHPLIKQVNDMSILIGETATVTPTYTTPYYPNKTEKFTYKSSNTSVASVNTNGVISARNYGKTTITITDKNKLVATPMSFKVTVYEDELYCNYAEEPIEVTAQYNHFKESTYQLETTFPDGEELNGKTGLTYKSSDTGVATVDENGLITVVASNTFNPSSSSTETKSAVITVTYKDDIWTNGKDVKATVNVTRTITPCPHTEVEEVVTRKATFASQGEVQKICTDCKTVTERKYIDIVTIETPIENFYYAQTMGEEIKPEIVLKGCMYKYTGAISIDFQDKTTINPDPMDYTVTYNNNVAVNQTNNANVTITINNKYYEDTCTKYFNVYYYSSTPTVTTPTTTYQYCQHTNNTQTVTQKATFDKTGLITETCVDCGYSYSGVHIDSADVRLKDYQYTYMYTGKEIKPIVVMKYYDTKTGSNRTIAASNYTVTYVDNTKVGTGKVIVTFKDDSNKYTGTKTLTFKIKKLKGTTVKAKKSGTKIKLTWKKQSKMSGYEIQYSTSKKFTTKTTKTVKKTSKKKNTVTVKPIKNKKTYYVRVRTYAYDSFGQKVYSDWSTAKKFKLK